MKKLILLGVAAAAILSAACGGSGHIQPVESVNSPIPSSSPAATTSPVNPSPSTPHVVATTPPPPPSESFGDLTISGESQNAGAVIYFNILTVGVVDAVSVVIQSPATGANLIGVCKVYSAPHWWQCTVTLSSSDFIVGSWVISTLAAVNGQGQRITPPAKWGSPIHAFDVSVKAGTKVISESAYKA